MKIVASSLVVATYFIATFVSHTHLVGWHISDVFNLDESVEEKKKPFVLSGHYDDDKRS